VEALNQSLFLMINAGEHPAPWMLWLATAIAQWLIYPILPLIAVLWFWGNRADREAALSSSLTLTLAIACNIVIGMIWMHPRPFMIELGHTFMYHKAETSFPSDHAAVFFSVGLALLRTHLRKTGAVIVLLGVAVGWSRVYLGVHFPFDIIGALLVSIVASWIVSRVLSLGNIKMRLLNSLETLYRKLFAVAINKGWVQA